MPALAAEELVAVPDRSDLVDVAYVDWTVAEIWTVFRNLVERDCPLPGTVRALDRFEKDFANAVEQVVFEHGFMMNKHFRTAAGRGYCNPINLEHLTRLMHYFVQRICDNAPQNLLDALFFVMKSRCSINLFYRQKIEPFFMPLHSLGTVLGYGHYGRFLTVLQGCTIGQNHDRYPTIGAGCVMGPQSIILGACTIGRNVRLAAKAMVIDRDVPDNSIVFGSGSDLRIKANPIDNRTIWYDMARLKEHGLL